MRVFGGISGGFESGDDDEVDCEECRDEEVGCLEIDLRDQDSPHERSEDAREVECGEVY